MVYTSKDLIVKLE